jgi:hypothetical protein
LQITAPLKAYFKEKNARNDKFTLLSDSQKIAETNSILHAHHFKNNVKLRRTFFTVEVSELATIRHTYISEINLSKVYRNLLLQENEPESPFKDHFNVVCCTFGCMHTLLNIF